MIRTILVAVDGSPRAPGVYAAAAEIARRFQAALIPLRVIFVPPEFPPAGHLAQPDPLRAHLVEEAEKSLAALSSSTPDVRMSPPVIRHGQPWRVILEVSNEFDVDLIVMGSHGYHRFDRVLGTSAGKVANLAKRNVLVVHDRNDRASGPTASSRGNDVD